MNSKIHFNALIIVTPSDCKRLLPLYPRLIDCFKYGKICFIGTKGVKDIIGEDENLSQKALWINEDDVIPFDAVHSHISGRLKDQLNGQELPRGVTGWYYQQFLKMQYSSSCEDDYYMVWDGDTVPCRTINMFSKDSGQPYLDLKHEYHPEYFDTLAKILPGFRKAIERSFISEHMLIRKDIMQNLIADIENNSSIEGNTFWEKIINAIEPEKIYDSSFSEFETYGTYVAFKFPEVYKLREWHSFRLGGSFFDINTICDRDFEWLGRDFDAISFERGQDEIKTNRHLFDNPEYQQKLSAKKMLQIAQMEYRDGYKEVWEDDTEDISKANVKIGGYYMSSENDNKTLIVVVSYNAMFFMQENLKSIRKCLPDDSYKIVVVDNGSTDGVDKYLSEQKDIIYIRNEKNVGFGPACNQAVKATIGTEYEKYDVFLLNNDTRLVFDALYFLKKALYSAEDVGAVGSVSNYAGNKQMIDVEFDTVDEYIDYGEKVNVPMKDSCLERVRLSGFSMLIKRKVWDEVGGFDEDFVPGYFEDDALSMEILRRGYRMKVVRNSFIYHAGSESFIKTDYNSIIQKNYALFKEKYKFDIMKYAYADGTVISQIPYGKNAFFTVLHYGCGLGAELKAIRSLFPNSECIGIEPKKELYDIAKATEKIYSSADELLSNSPAPFINIMIIEKNDLQAMSDELKQKLSGILMKDCIVLIKDCELEEFPYENIKMIVWDMDDTFWQGILSEGEVILPMSNVELIKSITDHGVVNSISSKNDEEKVIDELEKAGISNLFVFNNINWDEKGIQIKNKIETMNLRPENVLFIDDNVRNLEQARYYCDGLMTAGPQIIPYLSTYFARTKARDEKHTRLESYKLLERKNEEKINSESEEKFLYDSDIRISINRNCLEEIDRIHELVMRSNQLNYTKNRDHKEILTRLITNDWNDSAYIKVRDKFGDYGIVGFYCYNMREKKMEHFLFSCRILGMGVEQYVYNKLGCPKFEINGDVSIALLNDKSVPWIKEDISSEIENDYLMEKRAKVLLKGPCDLDQIAPYLTGGRITTEFNYVNDEGFITTGQNHSMHIWDSANLSSSEISKIIDEVPFITEGDFATKIFSSEYHVICYSLLQDCCAGLYRNKDTGNYISFGSAVYPLTDKDFKEKYISGEIQRHDYPLTAEIIDDFSSRWEFAGITPIELLFRNLDYIYYHVKGKPIIILILGSETDYEGDDEEFGGRAEIYKEINPAIREFAEDHDRMRIIELSDYITSQEDFRNSVNHLTRNVYYKIAGKICEYINEAIER
ncbi:MAG: HAD-IIIC family phosphatase [Butyrivibrio sp.]|uniref:HAD-IIIC family phosphatase n=1 Tax=Butyrivibrio sp. TaxID=28121 RepID=UPI001B0D0AC9|nr:HAD-IIIC family phosphatase [Butyrivibrio sp.]MBO6241715.1 HAD-IIIC family phosphatase [Butyrivibrio sp.]